MLLLRGLRGLRSFLSDISDFSGTLWHSGDRAQADARDDRHLPRAGADLAGDHGALGLLGGLVYALPSMIALIFLMRED